MSAIKKKESNIVTIIIQILSVEKHHSCGIYIVIQISICHLHRILGNILTSQTSLGCLSARSPETLGVIRDLILILHDKREDN